MSGFSRYIRSISSYLHCNESERQYYAEHMENSLGKDARSLCYEEIVHRLGTPEQWVISQVENLDAGQVILKTIHAYKIMKKTMIIIAALFLAFVTIITYLFLWDLKNRDPYIIYSDPIVITSSSEAENITYNPNISTEVNP